MLSVPEFIKGIETDNPTHDITHNFGKMMVLYSLLGGRPGITISMNQDGNTGFTIKAKNKTDANKVNSYINGVRYVAYGTPYDITTVCEQRVISVSIKKQK